MITAELGVTVPRGADLERVLHVLDPQFLALVRWDWQARMVHFPPEHPALGGDVCPVPDCGKRRQYASGLCRSCHPIWLEDGRDLAAFTETARTRGGGSGSVPAW